MSDTEITIGQTHIRQDSDGRYCINDLHRAAVLAGANRRSKEPGEFLRRKQTIELIKEISDTGNPRITPVHTVRGNFSEGNATDAAHVSLKPPLLSGVFYCPFIPRFIERKAP